MNTTINKQQWQEEEALRRFQLISPLLQAGLDDFQAAAPGRKPGTALKAAPTIPLSLHEVTPMSGGPIFAFHISLL